MTGSVTEQRIANSTTDGSAGNTADGEAPGACANCGAKLTGVFCGVCGQSTDELSRPALMLATDWFDGLLTWDGRFAVTVRALFTRPGAVARAYVDGKRASYTDRKSVV